MLLDVVLLTSTLKALQVELLSEAPDECGHANQVAARDALYNKMLRPRYYVDCLIFDVEHAKVTLVRYLVRSSSILVFGGSKHLRVRREIAPFSANVSASWNGSSETCCLCWCNRVSSAYSSDFTRLMLKGSSFTKIRKSGTGPRDDICSTQRLVAVQFDFF